MPINYANNVMTLLDAQVYDEAKARRRRRIIIIICVAVAVVAGALWFLRNWPEEHVANLFFTDLQKQDYEGAYGVWMHDPQWKRHPEQYKRYPYNEFYSDWGPGSEWGVIKSYEIYGSAAPKGGSGVVVEVIVNGRAEHARVWVEKGDKSMSFSPY
jgi:hypothetical protein